MNIMSIAVAIVVGIFYPIYIAATYTKINENIRNDGKYRLSDYRQTILIFWVLTILIVVNYIVFAEPSLIIYPNFSLLNITLIIFVLVFSYFQYRSAKISTGTFTVVKEKLKDIYHYLPKTSKELEWFSCLSVSAGICEEIIFRLFLFEFLKENINLMVAFIVTNLIFAITHIGSGKRNLVSSFTLGLLFSCIYYFTDNIWIAVLLHTSIDINVGLLGYRLFKIENGHYNLTASSGSTAEQTD